ncbi:hypothetical protein BKD30_10785 [Tersicoccus phoenicis]|uniref:HTH luxR-type domain-containing protein n=1 Tax=Tersicoccus phoenicis TaxID=554083 RepID=A0A1R1L8P4_9MICC|nr:LuxR family transcriptional regulator [Tersicoccus phoenicis]OMH23849.1 hypothetical protein BKD30_10785 [Tersicoccus phoenicis]
MMPGSTLATGLRTELAHRIAQDFREGSVSGLLIMGEAGSGKAEISDMVVDLVADRMHVWRIYASTVLSTIQFGALTPLSSGATLTQMASPIAVMRLVSSRLAAEAGDRAPLLLVSDVHLLDDSSAAVIAQLVAGGAARLLAFGRAVPTFPNDLLTLYTDGLIERIELPPLSEHETHRLCELYLGGPVMQAVGTYVHRICDGNPLLSTALIDGARRNGSLISRRGVWIPAGELLPADLRLAEVLRREMIDRSPRQRNALELVALSEELPLRTLTQLGYADDVRVLEAEDIVMVELGPPTLVRTRHPLYGELLRQLVPVGRSLALRQELATVTDVMALSGEGVVRYVDWSLDTGAPVDAAVLLRAARQGNDLVHVKSARRAACAVAAPHLVERARIEFARAAYLGGEYDQAIQSCRELLASSTDRVVVGSAAQLLTCVHLQTGEPSARLRQDASLWQAAIERLAGTGKQPDVTTVGIRLIEIAADLRDFAVVGVESDLREILDNRPDEEHEVVALVLLAEVLGWTGRPESGLVCSTRALELIEHQRGLRHYLDLASSRHLLCCLLVPSADRAEQTLELYQKRAPALLLQFGGAVDLAHGLVELRRGRLEAALKRLVPAVEALFDRDVEGLLALAVGVTAFAASLAGEDRLVSRCRQDFQTVPVPGWLDPKYQLAQAYVAMASLGRLGPAATLEKMGALARQAESSGMTSVEVELRLLAAELGDTQQLDRVDVLTAQAEGHIAELLRRYENALVSDERETQLLAVAARALELECVLVARSAARAVSGSLANGRASANMRALETELAGIDERLSPSAPVAPTPLDLSQLSRRERQIVELVRSGLGNRQVATQMSVSVRTVEGHLYRVYRKLGIKSRDHLVTSPLEDPQAADSDL